MNFASTYLEIFKFESLKNGPVVALLEAPPLEFSHVGGYAPLEASILINEK